MNKKTVKLTIVALMLLAIALYFVFGTYARYASEFTGTASLDVAKWAVKVTGAEEKDFTLNFTVQDNDNVVNSKIAPATKATASIEIDLNETEVATEVVVEKGDAFESAITGLGLDSDQITFSMAQNEENKSAVTVKEGTGEEGSPFVIALPGGSAFGAENGKLKIDLTLEWKNQDTNNTKDTAAGVKGGSISLPVNVKVQQHIENA